MKMNFGKRLLLFLHWLLSLAAVAVIVFRDWFGELLTRVMGMIGAPLDRIILIAVLVVYGILSIAVLCLIFKRNGKRAARGFITVDSAETGGVRIAVTAVEQMVKQAVRAVDGIADMKIAIVNDDDAISIEVNVSVISGSHVPTVTMNMQRAIRQFVEMNCGVAVRSVSVNVQTVVVPAENGKKSKKFDLKAAPVPVPVPVPAAEPAADAWTDAQPAVETVETAAAPVEEAAETAGTEAVEETAEAEAPAADAECAAEESPAEAATEYAPEQPAEASDEEKEQQ